MLLKRGGKYDVLAFIRISELLIGRTIRELRCSAWDDRRRVKCTRTLAVGSWVFVLATLTSVLILTQFDKTNETQME